MFQQTVVQKYLKAVDPDKVANAWAQYQAHFLNPAIQENIRNSKEEQYQGEFLIDLFVKVLGYTKNPTPGFNLTTELKNVQDSKKADGAIIINDSVKAVIELKGTKTTDLTKVQQQAFNYKTSHPGCDVVIISNFEKLRLFIHNQTEYQEFNLFTLNKSQFQLLYLLLAYEYFERNLLIKIKDESLSEEEEITKKLYKDYADFKTALFKDLTERNPDYDALTLFKSSQKLLDRFLFLFFAEDRGLLPPNAVREILRQWQKLQELDAYDTLINRFRKCFGYLNTGFKGKRYDIFAYNGGLFAPDEILDAVEISDDILYQYTQQLADYDYQSEVDVNILGHIFENSLNEIDEIKAELAGETIEKSKTKRKKDGVFYTPKYITQYIVENTVGKLCEEQKAKLNIKDEDYDPGANYQKKTRAKLEDQLVAYYDWLTQLTICDPACGSGAFLNQALDYLIKEHEYLMQLRQNLYAKDGQIAMAFPFSENDILENNLYGVDINEESVEIAKLSLWLRTAKPNRKLNSLNQNIKVGNSLIDDSEVAGEKAFVWEKEFAHIFEKGGFDVVIGNPPYVKEYTAKSAFDGLRTKESYQGKMDLWYFFGELALDIVKEDIGLIGIIAPNNWITNAGASNFRNIVLNRSKLIEFVDFGDFKVFESAGIQTMIYLMKATENNSKYELNYSKILNKRISHEQNQEFLKKIANPNFIYFKSEIDKSKSLNKLIHFINKDIHRVIKKIKNQQDFTFEKDEVGQGIVPPQDTLNQKNLDKLGEDFYLGQGIFVITQDELERLNLNEDELQLVKPFFGTEELYKYYGNSNNYRYIIYTDSKFKDEKSLDEYPNIKNHLDKFRHIITSSNKPYGLHRAREEKFFKGEKIVSLRKSSEPTFTYTDFDCYVSQTYFVIKTDRYNHKVLTSILNSKLIAFWLKFKGKMQGDLYQIDKAPLMQLPIKTMPKTEQHFFIEKADQMLSLNKELQEVTDKFIRALQRRFEIDKLSKKLESWYDLSFAAFVKELKKIKVNLSLAEEAEWEDYFISEKTKADTLKTQINHTDKIIDQMVYDLYGLTEEEVAIVEGS